MTTTPLILRETLASAYLRYFDTAFWLRDERLMAERRAILESSGSLYSECLLEPVLPYDATEDLLRNRRRSRGVAEDDRRDRRPRPVRRLHVPGQPLRLREHQAEAVTHHFRPGTQPGATSWSPRALAPARQRLPAARRCSDSSRKRAPGRRRQPADLWWTDSRTANGGVPSGRSETRQPRCGRWSSTRPTRWSRTR